MTHVLEELMSKYDDIVDKCLKWELIKYEIRKFTINYSCKLKKEENIELQTLHSKLNKLEQQLGNNPNHNISDEYYDCKSRIDTLEDKKAQGFIIRSKVEWLEKGERNTRFFHNLEKSNYNKKHIRKLELSKGEVITDSIEILNQTASFFEQLYKSKATEFSHGNDSFLIKDIKNVPKLNEMQKHICDSEITINECFKVLNIIHLQIIFSGKITLNNI